jgi:uncharacterized protein (DUF3820 family)
MALTDYDRMPYGIHKNAKMANVPAEYLIWLYDNDKCSGDVKDYIIETMDVLKQEIDNKKKQ